MVRSSVFRAACALFLALAGGVSDAVAEQPVVVELFTSQGCNACPPADAFLGEIAREPGVIALAYHVDYWDYLGWTDTFAKKAFTKRQEAYVGHADRSGIRQKLRGKFTPEIVVQGQSSLIGHDRLGVAASVGQHGAKDAAVRLTIAREGRSITLRCEATQSGIGPVDILVATYVDAAEVEIARGENAGKTLTYHRVVTQLSQVDRWDAEGVRTLTLTAEGPLVVLLQNPRDGRIVAAVDID